MSTKVESPSDPPQTSPSPSHPHHILSAASTPRPFLSPDAKKTREEKQLLSSDLRPTDPKERRPNHALFTIQENYYTRKNQYLVSPRPPKYRAPANRLPQFNEGDCSERSREKRVLFNDSLGKQDQSILHKKQSTSCKSGKPIIRNTLKEDNLSSSSKSISVQNSFVSQFHSKAKKERTRVDTNKQKYNQILHHFERSREMREERNRNKFARQTREKVAEKEEKYVDSIFPPLPTSIFQNPNRATLASSQIQWSRLADLYSKEEVVVTSKSGISQARVTLSPISHSSQFVAVAFNAVKHSSCILQRMFEEQAFNQYGLYLVRIFQQSNWKSVILDEHIPVISHQDRLVPAFVTVEREEGAALEIWPYLLEKAFAHYYSAYELLGEGNTIDFLNEITGLSPLEIVLKKRSEKEFTNLLASLESVDSFAIGEEGGTKKECILRLRYSNESSHVSCSYPPLFTEHQLTQEAFSKLSRVFLYSPKIYSTLSTNTIGKYSPSHQERAEYSIRKLVLAQNSDCVISVQQKEGRFFKRSSLDYHYMWVRVLLVQREFNGYRWIEGRYSSAKSITLSASLAQGNYYLIIMPEWKQAQNFELTLLVWGNHHVGIEKEKGGCEEMVEQACMDLAQRKGRINQLSPTLCSYNYVCARTGLLVENINNEKLKEEVRVHRSIAGIPSTVQLLPINKAFWPEKGEMLTEIEAVIPKLSSYTIVLKMRGGMDLKLVQFFQKEAK